MARAVLITGASSDIGLALVARYLDAGWAVVGQYRSPRPELDALAARGLELWQVDFAADGALDRLLARVDDRAFDAFVHLAAEIRPCPYDQVGAAELVRAFTVNAVPGHLLAARLGPAMAGRGWGRIVQASSIGVKFGGGGDTFAYSLSKHALEFIPSAARKWAAAGVLSNAVRVGFTDTRAHSGIVGKNVEARAALIPMGRAATPDDIAGLLFWLGSDQNTYVTGQVIAASGGE